MGLGQTIEHRILLQSPAKTHVFAAQLVHHAADRVARIDSQIETSGHLTCLPDDLLHETLTRLRSVDLSLPEYRMNKPVAQAMSVTRAIVIAVDRETGDQRMVNGSAIVAVALISLYWAALLMAVDLNRKAVDVDGCSHHGVISVATGATQVAVGPIEQAVAERPAPLF